MEYLRMLDEPSKFKHLDRFIPSSTDKKQRVDVTNLPDDDLKEFEQM